MKRRDFLTATLLTRLVCRLGDTTRWRRARIGSYFSAGQAVQAEFLAAMKEFGYREGRDCVVDFRDPARVTWGVKGRPLWVKGLAYRCTASRSFNMRSLIGAYA